MMFLFGKDLSPNQKVYDKNGDPIDDFMVLLYPAVTTKFDKYRNNTVSEEHNTLSFMCLNAGYGFKQL